VPRQDPGLRSATATNAVGVKWCLTHARPGGDRLRSSRANPADQFLHICPPRRDSTQEPTRIVHGRARSHNWRPSAGPRRSTRSTFQGEPLTQGRPCQGRAPKVQNPLPGRTKPPRRPTSPQPEPAHRRRLHDAGPGMLETPMERKRSPSGPGVAPSDASPRHAIVCPPRHPAPPVRDRLPTGPHADPR
jgi:hypothetical protein